MPRRRALARPLALFVLASSVVLALALAACGSAPGPTSGSATSHHRVVTTPSTVGTTTQQIEFTPYTAQGTAVASIHVTHSVTGTCVSPGVAGTSSYRCFAQPGSTVYDPCFAPPHASSGPLLCVADPAQPEAVSFQAATLPAAATSVPATQVWAMELANGQACIFVSAAWAAGRGPFACPSAAGTSPSEADCHTPRKSGSGFETSCQTRQSSSSAFETMPVFKLWS